MWPTLKSVNDKLGEALTLYVKEGGRSEFFLDYIVSQFYPGRNPRAVYVSRIAELDKASGRGAPPVRGDNPLVVKWIEGHGLSVEKKKE